MHGFTYISMICIHMIWSEEVGNGQGETEKGRGKGGGGGTEGGRQREREVLFDNQEVNEGR
jgi:hypothetical protein